MASTTSNHSRSSSQSATRQHQPTVPSGLRQTELPPPSPNIQSVEEHEQHHDYSMPHVERDGVHPHAQDFAQVDYGTSSRTVEAEIDEPPENPTAYTRLLQSNDHAYRNLHHRCGDVNCEHGTFSPRPRLQNGYGSIASGYEGTASHTVEGYTGVLPSEPADQSASFMESILGNYITEGLMGNRRKQSTTAWLVKRHGVDNERWLYFFYYVPFTNWIRQYRWSYLQGDLIAAITMASFYIPMALSLATNLAHTPPLNGLYTFVFNPLIYALLGTCPQMVVGPEAAGSLLTGSVVVEAIKASHHGDADGTKHAQVAGMVTGLAGGFIFIAGICRLGFLDGVLSRPFLRGFISAIGIVILVDQLIPEMGLNTVAAESQAAQHGSSLEKIMFLFRHGHEAHRLTCAVSFSTIAIVMVLREIKRRLQPRMSWVAYIPDRFVVVVLSAVFAWAFNWESQGLDLTGDIRDHSSGHALFQVHFPFASGNFRHVNDAFSTAFIIALLGFFESSVAAKSLGTNVKPKTKKVTKKDAKGHSQEVEEEAEEPGIRNINLSANRELVALGVANLIGGLFMALPGFGGYGRSKVNSSTGGKTPMSSIFLALITLICIFFLLPYFYYIPKGVLSAMISVVAFSLIEEAPHDIHFFWTISGYIELTLMLLIFLATFLWNLKIGIAVGIGLSLLRLLKHSTRPRIQILGRVPGTQEFESAELYGRVDEPPDAPGSVYTDNVPASERRGSVIPGVEMVPHCLIVKIPEPLTFANTGSLKDRLRRLEEHLTLNAHPALPDLYPDREAGHKQNVIFDVHGVTTLDPAACQVLLEIVESYVERGTRVFFCRVPGQRGRGKDEGEVWRLMRVSGIVDLCGGERQFLRSVDEALRATERESTLFPQEMGGEDEGGASSSSSTAHASTANGPGGGLFRRRDEEG